METAYLGGFLNINTTSRTAKPKAHSNIFLQKEQINKIHFVISLYCMLFSVPQRNQSSKVYSISEYNEFSDVFFGTLQPELIFYFLATNLFQKDLISRGGAMQCVIEEK
jgi:hypothetical protein